MDYTDFTQDLEHEQLALLRDVPQITEGYYDLEKHERNQMNYAIMYHTDAVQLWYRALTLHRRAMLPMWTLRGQPGTREHTVHGLQMQLLGLSVSASKAALDTLLAGYYSVAFATIRHIIESYAQCMYVESEPDQSALWYEQPGGIDAQKDPPGMLVMCQTLKARPDVKDTKRAEFLDLLYAKWQLMSKGSHPSGSGLLQTVDVNNPNRLMMGPTYGEDLCLAGFDIGFFAFVTLVRRMFARIQPRDGQFDADWEELSKEVGAWRDRNRQRVQAAEGTEPQVPVTIPLPSPDDAKRCWRLLRAREDAMNRMPPGW